jgi:8-oxo-dGTP diphosphatase
VTAPTLRRRRVAVYGVHRDDRGRVLLVPAGSDGWSLPGGTVAHGESPQAALARLMSAQVGVNVGVRAVRAASADQLPHPGGAVVHHDRLVFDVAGSGFDLADAAEVGPGARWFALEELPDVPLPAYTRAALGVAGKPAVVADLDDGWAIDRGLAMDGSGPRLRVQRFSTYALATDPAGRILLARIAERYPGAGRWHLPGGGTDFGEAPAAALLREVTEETGQQGRVVGLIGVSDRHNPSAMGWEGYPIDWHTIRVVYRVEVDEPDEPRVTEAAGGSTAAAAWFRPDEVGNLPLSDLAVAVIAGLRRGDA